MPFVDKFDLRLKNTASTRAWIGDGSFNEPNEAGGNVAGAALEDGAEEKPLPADRENPYTKIREDGAVFCGIPKQPLCSFRRLKPLRS